MVVPSNLKSPKSPKSGGKSAKGAGQNKRRLTEMIQDGSSGGKAGKTQKLSSSEDEAKVMATRDPQDQRTSVVGARHERSPSTGGPTVPQSKACTSSSGSWNVTGSSVDSTTPEERGRAERRRDVRDAESSRSRKASGSRSGSKHKSGEHQFTVPAAPGVVAPPKGEAKTSGTGAVPKKPVQAPGGKVKAASPKGKGTNKPLWKRDQPAPALAASTLISQTAQKDHERLIARNQTSAALSFALAATMASQQAMETNTNVQETLIPLRPSMDVDNVPVGETGAVAPDAAHSRTTAEGTASRFSDAPGSGAKPLGHSSDPRRFLNRIGTMGQLNVPITLGSQPVTLVDWKGDKITPGNGTAGSNFLKQGTGPPLGLSLACTGNAAADAIHQAVRHHISMDQLGDAMACSHSAMEATEQCMKMAFQFARVGAACGMHSGQGVSNRDNSLRLEKAYTRNNLLIEAAAKHAAEKVELRRAVILAEAETRGVQQENRRYLESANESEVKFERLREQGGGAPGEMSTQTRLELQAKTDSVTELLGRVRTLERQLAKAKSFPKPAKLGSGKTAAAAAAAPLDEDPMFHLGQITLPYIRTIAMKSEKNAKSLLDHLRLAYLAAGYEEPDWWHLRGDARRQDEDDLEPP